MANGQGGARIGAGRKKKALADNIADGNPGKRKLTVLDFTDNAADLEGQQMPPPKAFLAAKQKNGKDLLAVQVYEETWRWLAEREWGESDPRLLQAIRLHTTGAVGMSPLDLIVYVADVIEPGRYCAGVDKLRDMVGKVELEELFMATLVYVVGNLIERRKLIHSDTVTVWNHYVARAQERGASNDVKGSK